MKRHESRRELQRHSFVIAAYGDSPHLGECVASVLAQDEKSAVVLCTATPSAYIQKIAEGNNLPLAVNPNAEGIAADWNFALRQARTAYVTLAHQDDLYEPSYARSVCDMLDAHPSASLAFSDYGELRGTSRHIHNLNLILKRILLLPLAVCGHTAHSTLLKRLILSFGSPIPCPAVTYNMLQLENFSFSSDYTIALDWDAWLRLAERPGAFLRIPKILMWHRIHTTSATSEALSSRVREDEDRRMFARLLPPVLAGAVRWLYRLSYISNKKEVLP